MTATIPDATAVLPAAAVARRMGPRQVFIGLMAFVTVVDLFATQALLPSLVVVYGVSPAVMGAAVNAGTIGMAIAGLLVACFSHKLDRRWGTALSLAILAIPTAWLAHAPDLATFTVLRIAQGLLMATAFTLTLAHLSEETSGAETTAAFAAYVTGNVASNLIGRLISAFVADTLGLVAAFHLFAAVNMAGAVLAFAVLGRMHHVPLSTMGMRTRLAAWRAHVRNRALVATFGIGFCILFAFIGTFTYVNFVLVRPPLALGMMALGFSYFVFLPSVVTTPLAGRFARRVGTRPALWGALALAGLGLPMLVAPRLDLVLAGLVLVAVGTFAAQAIGTGYVGRIATADAGTASGLYLAAYFTGGIVGSIVLGQVFVAFGWIACVIGIGLALLLAARLTGRLTDG